MESNNSMNSVRQTRCAPSPGGYPTSENDLKNAKRANDPVEHAIPANAPGVAGFVRTVRDRFPNFEWRRLVDGKIPLSAAGSGDLN